MLRLFEQIFIYVWFSWNIHEYISNRFLDIMLENVE